MNSLLIFKFDGIKCHFKRIIIGLIQLFVALTGLKVISRSVNLDFYIVVSHSNICTSLIFTLLYMVIIHIYKGVNNGLMDRM